VLQVVLVLGLSLPERDGVADLGHDPAGPQPGGLDVGDRVLRDPALLVARGEDLGPVAGADVVALAILGRRIVDLEEELEDVPVGDALGVEDDLDRLGVARVVAVGRVVVLAAGVADPGGDDPVAVAQRSWTPQKQPPARMAVSVLSLMVSSFLRCSARAQQG
jgi:hypothetical protein